MALTVSDIAKAIGGTVVGDGRVIVHRPAALSEAGPGDVSFLAHPKHASEAAVTGASAVLVPVSWEGPCPAVRIGVANPDRAFVQVCVLLAPPAVAFAPGIHPTAIVATDATVGENVYIGPGCVVEPGARIGARTVLQAHCYVGHESEIGTDGRLYPFVSLRERVRVGNRVIIHNGAVIGSDGFGYFRDGEAWKKIPQLGTVDIGDDVEIGANTTVDRARFGKTIIENGVKIDNLVQIAHNVRVGEHTAMAAQVGIAGSSRIGRGAQLAGQVGVAGHLTVGDYAVVGAQAGVTKSVPPKTFVSGYPAMPHERALKMHAHVMRLPELKEKVQDLEARLAALETKAAGLR